MCGSDEPTRHEPQTRCQKLLVRIQALIFTGLAIYTIYSLFEALHEVTRTDIAFSTTAPSDRCVPFFDDVNAFVKVFPGTRAVFDFRTGEALTRICTNQTAATVNAAIGQQYAYDPWRADTGCDVLGTDRAAFIANCEMRNFGASDPTNCTGILNIAPLPYGAHWNMYAQLLTGNNSAGVPYPACSIRVTKFSGIPACTDVTMQPMHKVDKNIAGLMIFGVIVPFAVMVLQVFACYKYSQTWAAEDGWMLAFASRGPVGGIYMLWWVCKEGQEGRGEFPDIFLNFWGWLACVIQDAFEGLIIPLVAILGCRLDRYPVNAILVIVKAIKIVFDFAMYMKNRKETCEPGGDAEQKTLWASNPPVQNNKQQSHQMQPHFPQPGAYPTNQV